MNKIILYLIFMASLAPIAYAAESVCQGENTLYNIHCSISSGSVLRAENSLYYITAMVGQKVESNIGSNTLYNLCLGYLCTISDKTTRGRECPWVLHWDDNLLLTDPDEYFLSPICSATPSDTTECSGENDCVYNGVCYSADSDPDTVEFTINGEPASCSNGKWCPQYFSTKFVGNDWYCEWKSDILCYDTPCFHTQFTLLWFSKTPDCCSPDARTSCCAKKVWDGVYYYTKGKITIY